MSTLIDAIVNQKPNAFKELANAKLDELRVSKENELRSNLSSGMFNVVAEAKLSYTQDGYVSSAMTANGASSKEVVVDSETYTYDKVTSTYSSKTNVVLSKTMIDNSKKMTVTEAKEEDEKEPKKDKESDSKEKEKDEMPAKKDSEKSDEDDK